LIQPIRWFAFVPKAWTWKAKAIRTRRLFLQAWNEAATDFEKFTAAHYVARHQSTVAAKLEWDQKALGFALQFGDEGRAFLPSLYLNIAKCHEDLQQMGEAIQHYELAQSFASYLGDEGYGNMIRSGIQNGLNRARKLARFDDDYSCNLQHIYSNETSRKPPSQTNTRNRKWRSCPRSAQKDD